MTLIWSPSSLLASVMGWMWRPEEAGWVVLAGFLGDGFAWGKGEGEKYAAG